MEVVISFLAYTVELGEYSLDIDYSDIYTFELNNVVIITTPSNTVACTVHFYLSIILKLFHHWLKLSVSIVSFLTTPIHCGIPPIHMQYPVVKIRKQCPIQVNDQLCN